VPPSHLPNYSFGGGRFGFATRYWLWRQWNHVTVIAADDINSTALRGAQPTNGATMRTSLTFAPAAIALIACVAKATAGLPVIGSSITDRRLSGV
jgi:hypothetical protein